MIGGAGYLPVYGGEAVRHEGDVIGRLRSVAFGPTVERTIGVRLPACRPARRRTASRSMSSTPVSPRSSSPTSSSTRAATGCEASVRPGGQRRRTSRPRWRLPGRSDQTEPSVACWVPYCGPAPIERSPGPSTQSFRVVETIPKGAVLALAALRVSHPSRRAQTVRSHPSNPAPSIIAVARDPALLGPAGEVVVDRRDRVPGWPPTASSRRRT